MLPRGPWTSIYQVIDINDAIAPLGAPPRHWVSNCQIVGDSRPTPAAAAPPPAYCVRCRYHNENCWNIAKHEGRQAIRGRLRPDTLPCSWCAAHGLEPFSLDL